MTQQPGGLSTPTSAAVSAWLESGAEPPPSLVKEVLRELAATWPGRAVELRVPPVAAVQLIAGPAHRRGTPKATVEMDPATLLDLVVGRISWAAGVADGAIRASGERSDLTEVFGVSRPSQSRGEM